MKLKGLRGGARRASVSDVNIRKLASLLLLTAAFGFSASRKVSRDLAALPPDQQVTVIVRYTHQPEARHQLNIAQRGGRVQRNLELVNSVVYTLPASALADLENDPDVEYVSPDRPVAASLDYANPAINANIARQYGWTGSGVTVAVIDSGIMDSHPDLQTSKGASRVVYAQSFVPNAGNDYFDRYGHGTHVAAILGGDASQSTGAAYTRSFWGTAPNVSFVNLKVLDQNGVGTDSAVIAAIQQAIALKNKYKIKVINLSLGRPVMESYTLDPLCQAVEQAWKAGIVVIVAAGNDGRNNTKGTSGYGTISSPGNDPYVITVGAMKDMKTLSRGDDQMASYSSKGPTIFEIGRAHV